MTSVNWDVFQGLPGSATDNFEMLCRSLIRRHYGQYGTFRALAQQPGVEFHLKLYAPCSLGKPDRWYGWQCRWYGLPGGRAIGRTRRSKIREAIAKTAEVLPDLSDWVLWTRYPLTEGDQEWFYKLDTQMQLHLWADSEVEEHLSPNPPNGVGRALEQDTTGMERRPARRIWDGRGQWWPVAGERSRS